MRKKVVSAMLCMAMAATMLAGCGGNAGTASAGTDSSKKTAGGKEEVVIWDYFETDAQKNTRHPMCMYPLQTMKNS